MSYLTPSRLGEFLLHRGWFRLTLTRKARAFLSTGCNAVSPRQYIQCADHIGVVGVPTVHTLKLGLCLSVFLGYVPTRRTGLAGVLRRYRHEHPAVPVEFVFKLSPELEPTLIENRLVQSRLRSYVFSRLISVALGRLGHVPNLQVLYRHHRVVFTDGGRGLVQEVAPGIADTGVDGLNSPFGLLPVLAEFDFAAHSSLVALEPRFVLFEAVEWGHECAIAQGGETGNSHVDTDCTGGHWNRLFNLTLSLNTGKPLAARLAHCDVLCLAQNIPAVAVFDPAQLGQLNPAVGLVDLKALRKSETVSHALALEAWKVGSLFKEIFVRPLQVFERVLQGLRRGLFEPMKLLFPLGKKVCHRHIPHKLAARFVVGLLQGQRLVVDEPARTRKAAHVARLFAVWHEFVFEGLEPLHGLNYTLVYEQQSTREYRYSARQALCISDARPLGLCDEVSSRGVHQSHSGRLAPSFCQRVHRLRVGTGGVRWGRRPCSLAGELPAQGFCVGLGEQFEGRFQPNDSAKELSQHSQKTLGNGALVSELLCRKLWWRSHRHHSPIHRAAANAALVASFAGRALHPRPKGRGFPRKMEKGPHRHLPSRDRRL